MRETQTRKGRIRQSENAALGLGGWLPGWAPTVNPKMKFTLNGGETTLILLLLTRILI